MPSEGSLEGGKPSWIACNESHHLLTPPFPRRPFKPLPAPQVLQKANTLLAKYTDGRWVALLVSVGRDKVLFEAVHRGIEMHVNDIVRCAALQHTFAPPALYGNKEMKEVAAKVQKLTGCGEDMQKVR